VAIFTCPVDALQTETKGTVLIKTAEELTNYTRGEETQLENIIKVRQGGSLVITAPPTTPL
jgi:T-complex protein 1 subunit theta